MKPLKLVACLLFISFSLNLIGQTAYTTKTGKKYHKSSCRFLKYSKYEIQLNKARELGYTACKVCKPTKDNLSSNVNSFSSIPVNKSATKKSSSSQCTGKTKAGRRCKRMTKSSNGRCYQH